RNCAPGRRRRGRCFPDLPPIRLKQRRWEADWPLMRRPRTLAALALVLLAGGLAVGVPSASAIDPFPTVGVAILSSDNFTVHYSRNDLDSTCANYSTQEHAGDVLGMLERARSFYAGMGLGFPSPVPDTDAHVHVSIDDLTQVCVPYGAIPPATPIPWSRWDA